MNEFRKRLRESWTGLSLREQGLLMVMSVLLVGLLAYLAILRPLAGYHAQGRDSYTLALSDYRTLEAGVGEYRLRAAGAAQRPVTTAPLTSIVGRSALENDLILARLLPDDDGRLNVWIDRAPTRDLMAWLVELEQSYGISVARITLDRVADDFASAQLVLSRGGA